MGKIKQAVKHTGRARKEQIVTELVEKLDASSGLVFADYKGLTHRQLEDLKKELKKLDATIVITKNSLLKLSLEKSPPKADQPLSEKFEAILQNPTATIFINADYVEPLKKVAKAIKDFGRPVIKLGILDGHLVDETGVLKIASLPNRETLLAQFVGVLNSPIQGLAVVLNANIQKFVMTLDAIAKSKPQSPQPTPPGQTSGSENLSVRRSPSGAAPKLPQPAQAETPEPNQAPTETQKNNESAASN